MERLEVLKTYKLYIGGAFPRTESGRYYTPVNGKERLGNICRASRKDLRNAVVAARKAQAGWAGRTAYNRSQILYRIAEMLETRKAQFIDELEQQGSTKAAAKKEVMASVDRLIHYAGWCDKYQQIFSSVNPVASAHFNFSVLEPTGVVYAMASEDSALLGVVSIMAPIIAGGNTVIVLAPEDKPLSAITLAEVIHASDVPGGVVNVLTGKREELIGHAAEHMDINAIAYCGTSDSVYKELEERSVGNMKRIRVYDTEWSDPEAQGPYFIQDFCEVKTTWHPIERISSAGSSY